MAGIGEGFTAGLEWGRRWRSDRDEKKMNQARLELEARRHDELLKAQRETELRRMQHDAEMLGKKQGFDAEQGGIDRSWRSGESAAERAVRISEAQADRAFRGGENDKTLKQRKIETDAEAAWREKQLEMQRNAMSARDPNLATFEQPLDPNNPNGGKVSFKAPMSELAKMKPVAGDPYVSPYAKDIADAEKLMVEQEAQMAEGDMRGGFMGLQKRSGLAGEQKNRLARLKALELQDMVQKGMITQEEADARAKRYLPQ